MSELAQIITAIGLLVTALTSAVSVLVSLRNGSKLTKVEQKQDEQHRATNGRLDQLVKVTGQEQRAVGKAEGLAQAREEDGR